ncbi:Zinc finger and Nuclear hormone receptor domain containing protein [Trichostrongylus colubriformis]|uniref:Zinc finger and Nuclear hormone receptor domain containing protein n=1 Tax=Trichostrongylus colubriformis TaxID=6319 RepID=A0AAN8IFS5_TRICO
MSADAQPNPKQRANVAYPPEPPIGRDKAAVGALCVVCGDRACSHLYYGVAACHGCKCFFWRTVKSGLSYSCRFDGRCSISTAGRNACRYCRFNRCLKSGMKLEAVRMDKKNDKILKRKRSDIDSDEFDENQENIEAPDIKRQRKDHRLLTSSLMLIDRTASDGNGKMPSLRTLVSLAMVMDEPEILDGDRTEMSFRACAPAGEAACAESERRLLTWAIDWTRQVADMEDAISNSDKISLLRACCVPLTLLELGIRSSVIAATTVAAIQNTCTTIAAKGHVLPLPNNTYLLSNVQPPSNCFLTPNVIHALLKWTERHLKPLNLSPKELVLLKALVVLNIGSSEHKLAIIYQLKNKHSHTFQMISMEVVEHQRMRHTFGFPHQLNPLSVQLFGDIFEEGKTDEPYLIHSSSCSPSSVKTGRSQIGNLWSALHTPIRTTVLVVKVLLHHMEPFQLCSRLSYLQQRLGLIPTNLRGITDFI